MKNFDTINLLMGINQDWDTVMNNSIFLWMWFAAVDLALIVLFKGLLHQCHQWRWRFVAICTRFVLGYHPDLSLPIFVFEFHLGPYIPEKISLLNGRIDV